MMIRNQCGTLFDMVHRRSPCRQVEAGGFRVGSVLSVMPGECRASTTFVILLPP